MKRLAWIGGMVVIVAAICFIVLVIIGRVGIIWKSPSEQLVISEQLCDDMLINKYNETLFLESREAYQGQLATVVNEISEIDDYRNDPNCVHIMFTNFIEVQDFAAARDELSVLQALADAGVYVTSKIEDVQSVSNAEKLLENIEASVDAGQPDTPAPNENQDFDGEG